MNGSCSLCGNRAQRHTARQDFVVSVPDGSVNANLSGRGDLEFTYDVENTGFITYVATIQITVTQIGDFRTLLHSETQGVTVDNGQTENKSGSVRISPDKGTTLEICAEVTSIRPLSGGR